jgi:hypothetical protein
MISLLVAVVVALAWWATPWRGRSGGERVWLSVVTLNTLVCFGVPTVATISPWRSTLSVLSTVSYAASIVLTIAGGILWFRSTALNRAPRRWITAMMLCALPFLLWSAVGLLFAVTSRR